MVLKDLLVATKPREVSGSRSANRFDFQKSWALCHLLELHKASEDYLIVFDYHDDVLVLDSSDNPRQIDFYQIKTKESGHWTKTELLSRKSGKDGSLPSMLGNLILNKLKFPKHTRSLNLISNQAFKLAVKGRADSIVQEVCLKQLTDIELKDLLKALREEHRLETDPECAECTHLCVTSLSLGGHSDHAMGVLGRYLDDLYPGQKMPLAAAYKALSDEIKRKTTVEKTPTTFNDLCSQRSISKENFAEFLRDIKPATEFDSLVGQATSQLQHEGMGFDEIREITIACRRYEIDRMNRADLVLRKGRVAIAKAIARCREQQVLPTKLTDALTLIRTEVQSVMKMLVKLKSESYFSAMILMAIYGV